MKNIRLIGLALIALISSLLGTGCATSYKGTGQQLSLRSNVLNAVGSVNGSREEYLPHTWKLSTRKDSKEPVRLLVRAPDGRVIEGQVEWRSSSEGKAAMIAGGVGWGVVTGVGGLLSIGTDYYTKAYRELESDTVFAEFSPPAPAAVGYPYLPPAQPAPPVQYQLAPQQPPQPQRQQNPPVIYFYPTKAGSGTQ